MSFDTCDFPTKRFYKLYVEQYILTVGQSNKAMKNCLTLSGPAGHRHAKELFSHGAQSATLAEFDMDVYDQIIWSLKGTNMNVTTAYGDVSDLNGRAYSYIDLDFMRSMGTESGRISKMLQQQSCRKGNKLFTACLALRPHGLEYALNLLQPILEEHLGVKCHKSFAHPQKTCLNDAVADWVWQHANKDDISCRYRTSHIKHLQLHMENRGRISGMSSYMYKDGTNTQMFVFCMTYK